jgi:hypothetical protein
MKYKLQQYPCGCCHNSFAMAEGSLVCDWHFYHYKLHFCKDWDYLLISRDSTEFERCTCSFDKLTTTPSGPDPQDP